LESKGPGRRIGRVAEDTLDAVPALGLEVALDDGISKLDDDFLESCAGNRSWRKAHARLGWLRLYCLILYNNAL